MTTGLGGEALSLAVDYSGKEAFAKAGYANISTNASYVGGNVRQQGLFSFSRVFQAGHEGKQESLPFTPNQSPKQRKFLQLTSSHP